jgi:putative redox protein
VLEVEIRNVVGRPLAVGSAGAHTLIVDRPANGGGEGLGFNGGELLYLAVAGCVSNDHFREAAAAGISLSMVRIRVSGDFAGEPAVSTTIDYEVELAGDAEAARLNELVERVDRIAEIPNTIRGGTEVRLTSARVRPH